MGTAITDLEMSVLPLHSFLPEIEPLDCLVVYSCQQCDSKNYLIECFFIVCSFCSDTNTSHSVFVSFHRVVKMVRCARKYEFKIASVGSLVRITFITQTFFFCAIKIPSFRLFCGLTCFSVSLKFREHFGVVRLSGLRRMERETKGRAALKRRERTTVAKS